jgi:hypothetical protein
MNEKREFLKSYGFDPETMNQNEIDSFIIELLKMNRLWDKDIPEDFSSEERENVSKYNL